MMTKYGTWQKNLKKYVTISRTLTTSCPYAAGSKRLVHAAVNDGWQELNGLTIF